MKNYVWERLHEDGYFEYGESKVDIFGFVDFANGELLMFDDVDDAIEAFLEDIAR